MSNDTSAQSGKADVSLAEAEYNAVYAAVTATERGRWFLAEFANRNRKADTDLILAAIAGVDAAIRAGAAPAARQEAPQAVEPRENAPAVATSEEVSGEPFLRMPRRAIGGERDEDGVATSKIAAAQDKFAAELSTEETSQPGPISASKILTDEDYSDAVAAIAASLATRLREPASKPTEVENLIEGAAAPGARPVVEGVPAGAETAKPAAEMTLRRRVPQDNSPLWHIDGPDFVFGGAASEEALPGAETRQEAAQLQAQLLGAEIMSAGLPEEIEARSDATEEVSQLRAVEALFEAPPAQTTGQQSVQESVQQGAQENAPQSFASAALDVVPLAEIARPQMRPAREAMAGQRPPRYGSLTVTDALSEDEVIALFG